MATIQITACKLTSNVVAIEAVSKFLQNNQAAGDFPYQYTQNILISGMGFFQVQETPHDTNNPTCNCEFTVVKQK